MPYSLSHNIIVAGNPYGEAQLAFDLGPTRPGPAEGYLIELAVVMELLEHAETGRLTVSEVHDALKLVVEETRARSGCCFRCDQHLDSYTTAIEQYQRNLSIYQQFNPSRNNNDFLVIEGKIHTADCGSAMIPAPRNPGTLYEWVHEHGEAYHHYEGSIKNFNFMKKDEFESWYFNENLGQLSRRKIADFCKGCNSKMPRQFRISKTDPACWSWDVSAHDRDNDSEIEAFKSLRNWHGGRCAVCGIPRNLVVDHDHSNGAIRGLLCNSCNIREGREGGIFNKYRKKNPASILSMHLMYGYVQDRLRYEQDL